MKQKQWVIYLIGAGFILGLALILVATFSVKVTANSTSDAATIQSLLTAQHPINLQCGLKVPNGLAQCGSQASSCKNCHEVKGADPVNAKGDWHTQHAFGDFCEFCHGGNVQSTDKATAHQGMVQPLADVKTNCSSCHAADYQVKAQTYATTLGITLGSGTSGSSQPPINPAAPSVPATQQPSQAATSQAVVQPAATPTSSQVVDYVAQYRVDHPLMPSTGTVLTGLFLALTVAGGGSFVFWNEKRLRSLPKVESSAAPADERSAELAQLQPILKTLDVPTLRALRTILTNRRRDA
jgi:hypothetical protein